ncbi:MAG: DNA-deoxyinosine glycosylase [Clostridia bacterium]|nr:DNA-deoxyinosine glycosylase [Clostridia bacterium]
MRVVHPLEPIYSADSRILLLGTMPSPASRGAGFYYAHPQNRFWRVLAAVFAEPLPGDEAARRSLILRHGLALWDVLRACDIEGASDASIRGAVPNDVPALLAKTRVTRVLATGQTAARLYRRLLEPQTGLPCLALPSTSPANCRISFESLVKAYAEALR